MEPTVYRLRQDQKEPESKRHVRRCIILYCLTIIVVFAVKELSANPRTFADLDSVLGFLAFYTLTIVVVATLHVRHVRKAVEIAYASAQLLVDSERITSHCANREDITVRFEDVTALEAKPGNGMWIRGKSAAERVWLAEETESFTQLRELIVQRTGLTPKYTGKFWRSPIFISLLFLAAWFGFSISNGWQSRLFGGIAITLMIGQFIHVQRNPHVARATKRLIWVNVAAAAIILAQMPSKW